MRSRGVVHSGVGLHAQAHVVGGPVAVPIAQTVRQQVDGMIEHGVSQVIIQTVKERAGKGIQPVGHAFGQWRRARDELDAVDAESHGLQQVGVILCRREIPG